jgi:hypothetical protein
MMNKRAFDIKPSIAGLYLIGLCISYLFCLSTVYAKGDDFRGSSFIYRNAVSVNSFDKSAEPTYNPYYAIQFIFAPRYWFTNQFFIRSNLSLDRELTQADGRTYQNETLLSDWTNAIGGSLHRWKELGLTTFASASLRLPTSLASQARTMNAAYGTTVALIKSLQSWGSMSYAFGVTYTSFDYTTGTLETPRISQCSGSSCDPFLNTGVRNAPWQIAHSLNLNIFPKSWLFLSAGVTWIQSNLFPRKISDDMISYVPQEPTNSRYLVSYNIEADLQPTSWLVVAFMLNTFNPQLAPNSTSYDPFYNRFSTFMLDLRFTWGIFRIAQATNQSKKSPSASKNKMRSQPPKTVLKPSKNTNLPAENAKKKKADSKADQKKSKGQILSQDSISPKAKTSPKAKVGASPKKEKKANTKEESTP